MLDKIERILRETPHHKFTTVELATALAVTPDDVSPACALLIGYAKQGSPYARRGDPKQNSFGRVARPWVWQYVEAGHCPTCGQTLPAITKA